MLTRACVVTVAVLFLGTSGPADAQVFLDPNCQIVNQTVYEPQQVTGYRLQYETVLENQQVTTSRPVMETQTQERRYRVAKPVFETQTREERYKVLRPVTETQTRYQQHTVRRPVTETQMQDRQYVSYEPVTTMRTQYVDQGGFVDQTVFTPGAVRNRLRWLPSHCSTDPSTGTTVFHRGGLHWVPEQGAGHYTVQRQYVPNVVACQVPQTSYQQKVVTQKVPVTVTRYVDEVVSNPVQVQVQKWVEQEMVRPVTVTTQKMQWEERVEPVQVQVCRMVTETSTVQVPRTVAKWVPYTTTRMVPRTVTMRVSVDPCTGLSTYHSSSAASIPSTTYYYPPASGAVQQGATITEKPTEATGKSQPGGSPADSDETGRPAIESPSDNPPTPTEADPSV